MTVNAPRLVPETEVALLRHALRAPLEATPAGSGLQAVARAQAEKALAAYDGRPDLKPWVLTYDHRHGKDVSVVLSVDEPDGEAFYEAWEPLASAMGRKADLQRRLWVVPSLANG